MKDKSLSRASSCRGVDFFRIMHRHNDVANMLIGTISSQNLTILLPPNTRITSNNQRRSATRPALTTKHNSYRINQHVPHRSAMFSNVQQSAIVQRNVRAMFSNVQTSNTSTTNQRNNQHTSNNCIPFSNAVQQSTITNQRRSATFSNITSNVQQ
jgi:hypothetical protein